MAWIIHRQPGFSKVKNTLMKGPGPCPSPVGFSGFMPCREHSIPWTWRVIQVLGEKIEKSFKMS
jgi:hypothetical protein